jgi:hypothetical protein
MTLHPPLEIEDPPRPAPESPGVPLNDPAS